MTIFKEHSYEQVVKTKKKENTIEIIKADDFFKDLSNNGMALYISNMVKNDLQEFLCLDSSYKDLIFLKKVAKSTNEMINDPSA